MYPRLPRSSGRPPTRLVGFLSMAQPRDESRERSVNCYKYHPMQSEWLLQRMQEWRRFAISQIYVQER